MRYVLFATPRFGELVLRGLVERGLPPAVLVTNPDRPAGRDHVFTPPPAKVAAMELGVPFLQPEKLADIGDQLADMNADAFLVAAYGKILKPEILDIPRRGTLGVHPSLLPRHRGPSPMQQALLEGDAETGVSLFVVDAEVDHGPVVAEERLAVLENEGYLSLEARLAEVGAGLAAANLEAWADERIEAREQDHAAATFTRKFATLDAHVTWGDLVRAQSEPAVAEEVRRVVAALNPEPGAWTERDGVRIKLLRAEVADGRLVVTEYQVAGRKPVSEKLLIA